MNKYLLSWVAIAVVGVAYSAGAATDYFYSDYNGTNFDFTGLKETVQTADDETSPLFESPSGSGDQLIFSPSSFLATSTNNGGIDTTHSTFNATITSNGSAYIEAINITEGGDIVLSDFPPGAGTLATGVFASMSGTVTITGSTNAGDIGSIITFGGGAADFLATFTGGGETLYKGLQPSGTFGWTGSVAIDVLSLYTGVTEVELQYNNFLQANSEVNTSSLIQKKAINGPAIEVIPEPGTLALVAPGLIALGVRARRRRARS